MQKDLSSRELYNKIQFIYIYIYERKQAYKKKIPKENKRK
jgi:hypothetical protein